MWSTFFQILFPLLLTSLASILFGWWLRSRRYEDVTEIYDDMRMKSRSGPVGNSLTKADLDDRIASLSSSVAAIPKTNLDPLDRRLSKIESVVSSISVPETDLTPVYERMTRIDQRLAQPNDDYGKLDRRLSQIENSVDNISRRVSSLNNTDLEPLQSRFVRLERALDNLEVSAPDLDLTSVETGMAQLELAVAEMDLPQTDLSPIQEQLVGLELRVVDLAEAIEDTRGKDFELINSELGSLSSSFSSISMPDLSPVEHRLASVERAVSGIQVPEPDLGPLHLRLERLSLIHI